MALSVIFLVFAAVHRQPMDAFKLRESSFAGFQPRIEGWALERRTIPPDPIEPNILSYRLTPSASISARDTPPSGLSLRLVHGYNVRDCMRIKGYLVSELPSANLQSPISNLQPPSQLWRMVSPAGVTSIWSTAMLRADTFQAADKDVRSMPFPRVGVPDDPDWAPRGITLAGLRHPVENIRKTLRSSWNSSRSDLLTFLGFRRPAWVQAEWLTLVIAGDAAGGSQEQVAVLLAVQDAFVRELVAWRVRNPGGAHLRTIDSRQTSAGQ